MSAELSIHVMDEQGAVPVKVLMIEGELNSATYLKLQEEVDALMEAGAKYFLLDLSGLAFMSSAGLRAIHYMHMTLTQEASDGLILAVEKSPFLKIAKVPTNVQKVIRAIGLDQRVELYDSRFEAMASFQAVN